MTHVNMCARMQICASAKSKGPATRNDFVNDIVNDRALDAIFAMLKTVDETSTISSTISLCVAWPLMHVSVRVFSMKRVGTSADLPDLFR